MAGVQFIAGIGPNQANDCKGRCAVNEWSPWAAAPWVPVVESLALRLVALAEILTYWG